MKNIGKTKFRSALPDTLDCLSGPLFLSDEDKKALDTWLGHNSNNHLEVNATGRIPRIIFFGSGLGELLITRFLIRQLTKEGFRFKWWFTVISDSFRKRLKSRIASRNLLDIQNRSVLDAVARTRPDLLCVLEHSYPFKMTEMMRLCSGWAQCPVFMLSARADRSWLERTALFGPGKKQLYKDSFQSVSYAVTDDQDSAAALYSMNITPNRIIMGPSLKWHTGRRRKNAAIRSRIREYWDMGQDGGLILMLASIHNSEIYPVLRMLKNQCKRGGIRLILAPHISLPPLHASAVLIDLGFSYQRWSRMDERPHNETEVLLIDTYGDLAAIYSAADLAYIGGGFDTQYHGHNVVEAAALQVPVVIGPDFSGFKSIVKPLINNRGIEIAGDFSRLSQILNDLLSDSARREQLARRAFQVYRKYVNAEPLELQLLRKYLQSR